MPFSKILNLFPTKSPEHEIIADATKSYQKLQKNLDQLVRHSDRLEEKLRKASQDLQEKNEFLEFLTTRLSKYLSPQIFNSIFENKTLAQVGTQRKPLTVFFSDIANFTAISEQSKPEALTFYLNDYLAEMSYIALEHGATIDKFIGDAIMIFFGDPETLGVKQDALQCVKMAVAMQEKMLELRAKWSNMGFDLPFHIRMGINSGFCNVGNFGFEHRMEYTIIGGTVNLASRLEGLSDVDGILISQETYALIKDEFDCEARGLISGKGSSVPVKTFAVQGLEGGATLQFSQENPRLENIFDIDSDALSQAEKNQLKNQLMQVIKGLD